jgi:hypothetical protein
MSSDVGIVLRCATIHSSLSYWSDYFSPEGRATRPGYSTGWIAERLYGILAERGTVDYWDYAQRPLGTRADVFVGHFWAFADLCVGNDFERRVAVYVLSDPVRAATLLRDAAARHGVPYPDGDLPPSDFDHEATMESADAVILLGTPPRSPPSTLVGIRRSLWSTTPPDAPVGRVFRYRSGVKSSSTRPRRVDCARASSTLSTPGEAFPRMRHNYTSLVASMSPTGHASTRPVRQP